MMESFLKGYKAGTSSKITKDVKTSSKTGAKRLASLPWVEKYRPKTIDDVAYQEEIVAVLKKTLQGADFPNLLFYGPPGTGKTSTILALAREMFGDMYRSRILELNASDERGIQVVREKVKTFAQQTASSTRPDGKPCPPFKIIILDEADSMTNSAQILVQHLNYGDEKRTHSPSGHKIKLFAIAKDCDGLEQHTSDELLAALRRTMEKESKSTRFCLICNYVSRIIEPLTSRCSKFRFKPLAKDVAIKRLQEICQSENVQCETEVLEKLIDLAEGDLRRTITLLQSVYRLKGDEGITVADVMDIAGVIPTQWIDGLFKAYKSDSYEKLEKYVNDMVAEGYSAGHLISQLHDRIVKEVELNDKQKSIICERLAVCDHRLMEGADEYLQIMDLSTVIMEQICHST